MSTFFSNPFSSAKRRRQEELELGGGSSSTAAATTTPAEDIAGPDTPPITSNHLSGTNFLPLPRHASSSSPRTSTPPSSSTSPNDEDAASKVRSRAQYFEALIRSRSATPPQQQENPSGNPTSASPPPPPSAGAVTVESSRTGLVGGLTAAAAADALHNLRIELDRVDTQRRAAIEALRKKEHEVENLKDVVRHLSESRSAALTARTMLAEQYCDLQRAHARVSRVADLSRAVSKENLELTKSARGIAAEASRVAVEACREAAAAGVAEHRACTENVRLREKVSNLSRLTLEEQNGGGVSGGSGSACKQEFVGARVIETY